MYNTRCLFVTWLAKKKHRIIHGDIRYISLLFLMVDVIFIVSYICYLMSTNILDMFIHILRTWLIMILTDQMDARILVIFLSLSVLLIWYLLDSRHSHCSHTSECQLDYLIMIFVLFFIDSLRERIAQLGESFGLRQLLHTLSGESHSKGMVDSYGFAECYRPSRTCTLRDRLHQIIRQFYTLPCNSRQLSTI